MTYIKIPFDKVEQLIAYDKKLNIDNIDNPKLMPEVEQWCCDNLKLQPILPQRKDHNRIATANEFRNIQIANSFMKPSDRAEGLYFMAYVFIGVEFQSDADAILFKMRWL